MVVKIDVDELHNEMSTVRRLLERKSSKNVLARASLERRLMELSAQLEHAISKPDQHASVALVFDGAPVIGAKSIDMGFASQALKQYQDLIYSVASVGSEKRASNVRKIEKSKNIGALYISGVIQGSFGFVLEEDNSQYEMMDTRTKDAVLEADNFIETVSSDKSDFYGMLSEVDPKVFQKLKSLINTIHSAKAVMRISERKRTINLSSNAIALAHDRVMNNDVNEGELYMRGKLIGFSPVKRTFDFHDAEADEMIAGKVSPNMAFQTLNLLHQAVEPDARMSLGKKYVARVHYKDVERADGKPLPRKFTLLNLDPDEG